jgi:hypothetical protein
VNITSYNVTDVGYHYIGLRVLAAMPTNAREEQVVAISRNVLKYAREKALRLMLPEPRGSFESVGEKVCQELQHFQFAQFAASKGYQLSEGGNHALSLLNEKRHAELRRAMVSVHLVAYDNLRQVVQRHVELGGIWSPIVEAASVSDPDYAVRLLLPTFHEKAVDVAGAVLDRLQTKTAKGLEDALREAVLEATLPSVSVSVPLFRSMCDRLVSLRLLNIMKTALDDCDFAKSYSPCVAANDANDWHTRLDVKLKTGGTYSIGLSEPNMDDPKTLERLLEALSEAFDALSPQAGYYDLPDVRDFVCERLRVPEAAIDEGVNKLLDKQPSAITVGLTYERISGRRKPLVRVRESTQVFNLVRRA